MTGAAAILRRAFEGVLRRRQQLALWAAFLLAQSLSMLPFRDQLLAVQTAAIQPGGGEIGAGALGAAFFAILLSSLATLALGAAMIRAALLDRADRFAHLQLGFDELRLIGAAILQILIFYALILVPALLGAIIAGILGVVAGGLAVLLLIPAAIVMIAAPLYVGLRLWLTFPLTLLRHRISIRESWHLSQGRVVTLLGILLAIMLLGILMLVPLVLLMGIPLGGTEAEMIAALGATRQQSLGEALLTLAVGTLIATPLYAFVGAAFAEAALALIADREALDAPPPTAAGPEPAATVTWR